MGAKTYLLRGRFFYLYLLQQIINIKLIIMCKPIRSVAKIKEETAKEIGVDYKDKDGNFVVALQLAEELEPGEFSVIRANLSQDAADGILPINPSKPILRPKP